MIQSLSFFFLTIYKIDWSLRCQGLTQDGWSAIKYRQNHIHGVKLSDIINSSKSYPILQGVITSTFWSSLHNRNNYHYHAHLASIHLTAWGVNNHKFHYQKITIYQRTKKKKKKNGRIMRWQKQSRQCIQFN